VHSQLAFLKTVTPVAGILIFLIPVHTLVTGTPVADDSFIFENIAQTAGIQYREINFATEKKYSFETMGGAVAALDYNNDGFVDLLFLNGAPSPEHLRIDPASYNRLYRPHVMLIRSAESGWGIATTREGSSLPPPLERCSVQKTLPSASRRAKAISNTRSRSSRESTSCTFILPKCSTASNRMKEAKRAA
jgi:hypothetical protein